MSNSSNTTHSQQKHAESTLRSISNAGRPRRRANPPVTASGADVLRGRRGFEDPYAVYAPAPKSAPNTMNSGSGVSESNNSTGKVPIPAAVLLWYLVGVMSIASSKILLSTHNVPPLVLTTQQLIIGMSLLRTLLELQTSGEKDEDSLLRRGLQLIPIQLPGGIAGGTASCLERLEVRMPLKRKSSNDAADSRGNSPKYGVIYLILALMKPSSRAHIHNQLFLAGIYFALGFLLTNFGFQSGSAAFVETVKAAEPFTSASVAVLWGIERLGKDEVTSLIGIMAGVVLSTMGHRGNEKSAAREDALEIPSQSLVAKCFVVMLANLCFSFRGLHQKLFRGTTQGKVSVIDDLNLQYRMQQIGVLGLIIPTLLENTHRAVNIFQHSSISGSAVKHALRYILLSLLNGIAFTSYNLASTYVLTRISVVHHAALNCIRRVFAIVVTSIIFGLKITSLQVVGITLAVGGFFAYIRFKMKKEAKEKGRKELRKKWSGAMLDAKSEKWTGKNDSMA